MAIVRPTNSVAVVKIMKYWYAVVYVNFELIEIYFKS